VPPPGTPIHSPPTIPITAPTLVNARS
jgi:hypothetical protein